MTTYTIDSKRLDRAARVLNSTKSTAGDYYDALKELVSFAEPEEEMIETFDVDGNAVEVPETVWRDWKMDVQNGNTYRSLIDYYREEWV